MDAPSLTPEQHDALVEALAEALEELVDRTCADMGPLWLEATRAERANLGDGLDLGFTPSARYRGLSKGARSRYRALAAWRHAVLWRGTAEAVAEPDYRRATLALYFTPYPDNAPPYAWSRSAAAAPDAGAFPNASTLKNWAKEGCWIALRRLREEVAALKAAGDWHSELQALLLRPATAHSLVDELKLEDFREDLP